MLPGDVSGVTPIEAVDRSRGSLVRRDPLIIYSTSRVFFVRPLRCLRDFNLKHVYPPVLFDLQTIVPRKAPRMNLIHTGSGSSAV
jgi:hypothetical protein